MKKKNHKEFPSELRRDLISGDWVIIAKGRAKKPKAFQRKKKREPKVKEKDCPFCNIETQKDPVLIYNQKGKVPLEKGIPNDWTLVVIPNLYPALLPSKTLNRREEGGLYQTLDAVGHCELVIPRDHKRNMPHFDLSEIEILIESCKERYLSLMDKPFVNYISIFQNYGPEAGASQPHPHLQIITTPLIDVDLIGSLKKAEDYYKENNECIYCKMIEYELESKERIIYENNHFIALCPFASKTAFQIIITPKEHLSNFERITKEEKRSLADAAQKVAISLNEGLNDPDYNFYLHTSPCDGEAHDYYHWHWTVLPKTGDLAGFELGTHMEISVIEPEKAAEHLRKFI
jgi:UDPglucose--hexose-1-phosphate uridylyltransferase